MRILAIDTATLSASAAIIDEEKLHGEIYTDYKLKHSEKLLPLIEELFEKLHLSMQDIDAFAVTQGPGSFTGLRIGAATVKSFAHAQNKPIIPISTLEACAFLQNMFPGLICPILDAQQNSVYTAMFENKTGKLNRISEDAAIPLSEMMKHLPSGEDILFCGDAVKKFRQQIENDMGKHAHFANSLVMMPKASAAGALALEYFHSGICEDYLTYLPNYIRASQAEVNYEIKVK